MKEAAVIEIKADAQKESRERDCDRDGDWDRDVFFMQLLSKLQMKEAAEIEIKADAQKESRERVEKEMAIETTMGIEMCSLFNFFRSCERRKRQR